MNISEFRKYLFNVFGFLILVVFCGNFSADLEIQSLL